MMPLLKLSEAELREVVKRHIETLEFWLRRVVHEGLLEAGGPKYWDCEPQIIKRDIRDRVTGRINKAPSRFPRWIDATLLEHLIGSICSENLYRKHFKIYFISLFPANFLSGREYLIFILDKCADVRNLVYHSNSISIRQAEQTLCYANDIIDSIKNYYSQKNMQNDFNVPSIISYSDSFGRKVYADQMEAYAVGKTLRLNDQVFRSGDSLKMEVEVDSTFKEDEYDIMWRKGSKTIGAGPKIIIDLDDSYVGEHLKISVEVISKKQWHRYSGADDILAIRFAVLPPLSH